MIEWIKALYQKHRSFVLYAIAGVINTIMDYLTYIALLTCMLPVEVCQACGHIVGVIISFLMNRNFAFRQARGQNPLAQGLRFLIINTITLIVSVVLISLFSRILPISLYLVKIPVTVFTTLISYTGYKFFVFKDRDNKKKDGGTENDR